MTDREILEGLASGGRRQDEVMEYLYFQPDYRKAARQMVGKYRAIRLEDWEGVFHESLVDFIKKLMTDHQAIEKDLYGYFRGICRNKCREIYRKESRDRPEDDALYKEERSDEAGPLQLVVTEELRQVLRHILGKLSDQCQEIFRLWARHYSMKEIAAEVGLSNERTAITYKARCKKQLIKLLEENPALEQLLRNYRWI